MNAISIVVLIFALFGALDRIFGNKFGLGQEFEKGFMLFGIMMLTMTGMITLAPGIAELMRPLSQFLSEVVGLDASIIPAVILANDMGGAPLALEMASDATIGGYNAFVVASMMGCTVSFTIPFALGMVKKEQLGDVFLGLLCGIVTIPVGCLVSGIVCGINILELLFNLLPLILFSAIIAVGIIFAPNACVKIFSVLGAVITGIITVGLALGIFTFLTGLKPIPALAPIEEGTAVCLNAAIVLAGAFPFMALLARILRNPLKKIGKRAGMNEMSAVGLLSSFVTCSTVYGFMDKMDRKGVLLNAAFSVSGAFVFGSHLAYTMANDDAFVVPMIVGKVISGISAVIVAAIVFSRQANNPKNKNT